MRCQWGALLWKFTSAVSVCRSSCSMAEQSAIGLTDLLASGGQHFSIFNALILNFPGTSQGRTMSTLLQITFKNAVYIWKFMPTLAFSSLSSPSTVWTGVWKHHSITSCSRVRFHVTCSHPSLSLTNHIVSCSLAVIFRGARYPFSIDACHDRRSPMHKWLFGVDGQHTIPCGLHILLCMSTLLW